MSKMTQEEYLQILFADCGYITSAQRKGWIALRFHGCSFADELSTSERSHAIDLLKREKDNGPDDAGQDEDHV